MLTRKRTTLNGRTHNKNSFLRAFVVSKDRRKKKKDQSEAVRDSKRKERGGDTSFDRKKEGKIETYFRSYECITNILTVCSEKDFGKCLVFFYSLSFKIGPGKSLIAKKKRKRCCTD